VQVPGEKEASTRAARLAHGVPLEQQTWSALVGTAASLGVAAP
jgi:uncharacterized oxidoreductase